jgi:hypothetical protein
MMIHYRNPRRPDEAGITLVHGSSGAAAEKQRLELRGFVVSKIEPAPFAARRRDHIEACSYHKR